MDREGKEGNVVLTSPKRSLFPLIEQPWSSDSHAAVEVES